LKVNNNKFKLFIIVTFPNKVKLLLLHDWMIFFYFYLFLIII
jgi:hypothetical protein